MKMKTVMRTSPPKRKRRRRDPVRAEVRRLTKHRTWSLRQLTRWPGWCRKRRRNRVRSDVVNPVSRAMIKRETASARVHRARQEADQLPNRKSTVQRACSSHSCPSCSRRKKPKEAKVGQENDTSNTLMINLIWYKSLLSTVLFLNILM